MSQLVAKNAKVGTMIIRTEEAITSGKIVQCPKPDLKGATVEIQQTQKLSGVTRKIPQPNGNIVTFGGAIKIRVSIANVPQKVEFARNVLVGHRDASARKDGRAIIAIKKLPRTNMQNVLHGNWAGLVKGAIRVTMAEK